MKKTLLLALLIVIWGASWSINKSALAYTPPLLFASLRAILGGFFLSLFIFHSWHKIQWKKHWRIYLISSILNISIFFGIQTIGLIHLPGGLFSVLVYLQPVLVGIFAAFWLNEKLSPLKLFGLLIGFIGIFIISSDGLAGNISLYGVSLGLLTAICWAVGLVYVKKYAGEIDAMWMVVFQSVLGGFILLLFGSLFESWGEIQWTPAFIFPLLYGSTLGIPIAFAIYYYLIYEGEASKVASFTFLVPIFSVFFSSLIYGEQLTITLLVGLIFIVCSITIVNYKKKSIQSEETAEANQRLSQNKKTTNIV